MCAESSPRTPRLLLSRPDESGAWDFETRTDPPADAFFHSRSVSMESVSSVSSASELLVNKQFNRRSRY